MRFHKEVEGSEQGYGRIFLGKWRFGDGHGMSGGMHRNVSGIGGVGIGDA